MSKVVLKKRIIKLKNNKENLLYKNMRIESLILNAYENIRDKNS